MQVENKTNFKGIESSLQMSPEAVIDKIKLSKLTGRGGACFPTGKKWEIASANKGDKFFIVNADESEPGNFKDQFILKNNPDLLIEGLLIGCHAVKAKKGFIYIRDEYRDLIKNIQDSVNKYLKKYPQFDIEIITGAGAYVCGEETAILESIEGLPGIPRMKPPYPGEKGLENKPTVINNVETTAMIPLIMNNEFNSELRLFSVSGNVKKPGVYEFPIGIKLKEILEKAEPEGKIKAIFMGASGGCLKYDPEINVTQEAFRKKEVCLGSRGIIVINENQSLITILKYITEFFIHESCGKCTPCREGNVRILELIDKSMEKVLTKEEYERLNDLANYIKECSFCGLGMSSTTALLNILKEFSEEFKNA